MSTAIDAICMYDTIILLVYIKQTSQSASQDIKKTKQTKTTEQNKSATDMKNTDKQLKQEADQGQAKPSQTNGS